MATSARTARSGTGSESAESLAAESWQRIRALTADPETVAAEHRTMHALEINGGPLRALRYLSPTEPLSMRELAARMQCDNSYVTGLVDVLERRGLATREPHPTDRRVKVIELTASGREAAARVQREYATPPAAFSTLSRAELTTLTRLLRRLEPGA